MKILILSDLQGIEYREWMRFMQLDTSQFDVVFFLGDIDHMELSAIVTKFSSKQQIGVLGNHDYYGDLEAYGITNVHGNRISFMDQTIVGLEGSIKYKKERAPMFTQEEALKICEELPEANIVIAHNSPKGIHDKEDLAHEGFLGLERYIREKRPTFVFHGHQHVNKVSRLHHTWVVSVYGGIIFDTETRDIQHVLKVLD
ncbi:Icc-related predicted phosphoesterase [Paenibacillus sp. 1182]|uniref:metallophosphoesterase family protein n=1 Tax=Paenibacillus sp. 1182 TaxID=2806565 RepID=UPI001AE552EC|nr:metallophosphoesterase [Paenibacillus sp. 1182]MBP1309196.1 Icc-related predicted phosphoesterase [Paenibacillus sp. 1182]